MNFPNLQKLFKFFVASGLGLTNLAAIFWITAKTQSAFFCTSAAKAIPDTLIKPLQFNLSSLVELPVNAILKLTEGITNTFLWLTYGFGAPFVHIPGLQIPRAIIALPTTPANIVPYLRDPQNILALCNYTNAASGIALAVAITTALSSLTVFIVTSNLPTRWSSWINRRKAIKAVENINRLKLQLQEIEVADLDYDLQNQLRPIRDLLR